MRGASIPSLTEAWQHLQTVVTSWEGGQFEGPPDVDEVTKERLRWIGQVMWHSPAHAQRIMVHAYAALLSVPEFITEAHRRQRGRFSTVILRHAIANTAATMWQAFWIDFDPQGKLVPRDLVPFTGVLFTLHRHERPTLALPPKPTISPLPMAFFLFHIIKAAEFLAEQRGISEPDLFEEHFRYLGWLLRRSGYHFPDDQTAIANVCHQVDELFVRDHPEVRTCWHNLLAQSDALGLGISGQSIHHFLCTFLPCAASLFARCFGLSR